ncbi:DUF2341 domain-containing protein, partial [candidate division WWE3 bacterium]|nr:DUF2341 domain-containing protein [candidate division WWE3 bacterium]
MFLLMKFREKITANRITLPNWEFEILVVLVLLFGITLGTYITLFAKWPSSFALTQDSVTRDTSTDFNQGTYSQTEISGTGSAAYVQLQGSGGAGWFDNNWNFRRPIQITNTGSVLTNYQVDVSVTYDAGMQPDFDDIRFANSSGSELDFWLKQKSDSTDATFIVEVDTIASSSTTTIYMYYGNSGASSMSNAQNTFLHFVNFNTDGVLSYGGSQDTQSSSYEILDSGNTLRIYGNSWKVTNANFTVASGQLMQAEFRSAGDDAEINGIGFDT